MMRAAASICTRAIIQQEEGVRCAVSERGQARVVARKTGGAIFTVAEPERHLHRTRFSPLGDDHQG